MARNMKKCSTHNFMKKNNVRKFSSCDDESLDTTDVDTSFRTLPCGCKTQREDGSDGVRHLESVKASALLPSELTVNSKESVTPQERASTAPFHKGLDSCHREEMLLDNMARLNTLLQAFREGKLDFGSDEESDCESDNDDADSED
eukprot:scaffold921_cov126-Cylindrotheca_fusiformis.AAC.15